MTAIINATLVMRDHYIPDAVLLMENGKIQEFGPARKLTVPENCEIIDAEGLYVGPGFVDIHVHGGGGYSTALEPLEAAAYFLENGTTTLICLWVDASE